MSPKSKDKLIIDPPNPFSSVKDIMAFLAEVEELGKEHGHDHPDVVEAKVKGQEILNFRKSLD